MYLDACSIAPGSWKRLSIKDICQRITSGGTPSRKRVEFYTEGTIGWVKTKELNDNIINRTEECITPLAVKQSSAKLLPENTILLAMYGATVGMLGILGKEMTCNQACCAMLVRSEFDRDYLFYQLLAHRSQLQGLATGAAQQNLSGQQIKELILPFPDLEEQRAIGSYLRCLDDRITLLRETNKTLESIAQAIFKSWFVDFDPVHAKMEGRQPEGMDEATATLFPDSFEESELGLIPRGWSVNPISNVIQTVGGGTPATKNPTYWSPETYHWTSPKDLSGLQAPVLLNTERRISAEGLKKISSGLLPKGTLLMSSRAPIGYLALTQIPLAVNQGYIAILPEGQLTTNFMLFWCKQNMAEIKGRANGSTFMEISKKVFRQMPIITPTSAVLDAFENIVHVLLGRITQNEHQIRTLTELRDTLLPRLISGQLRLPEAESLVQEACP